MSRNSADRRYQRRSVLRSLAALPLAALPLLPQPTRWLIDEGDFRSPAGLAKAPALPAAKSKSPRTRGPQGRGLTLVVIADEGPEVKVLRPEESTVSSPLDIHITFRPRKHPIRLESLQLTAYKEIAGAYWGGKDIKSRIRQHISASGIDLRQYKMPTGKYRIDLRIEDSGRQVSHGQVFLHVRA